MQDSNVLLAVRRYGFVTTDALLDRRTEFFSLPSKEGLIGYRRTDGAVVVLGDPVAPLEEIRPLTEAFHAHFESLGVDIIYLLASERFKTEMAGTLCPISIELAEILSLDPSHNPFDNPGERGSLVRRKVRRALKEGVSCQEERLEDFKAKAALEEIVAIWLQGRKGRQAHISKPEIFDHCTGKRLFVAYKEGSPIGLVILNRLDAYHGWLLNHLMVLSDVPHGTSELLVVKALEEVALEGCNFITWGAVPLDALGEIIGLSPINDKLSRLLFLGLRRLFLSGGLNSFWSKFEPNRSKAYILFNKERISPSALISLTRALNISV